LPTYQFVLLQAGDDAVSPGINYRYLHDVLLTCHDIQCSSFSFAQKYRKNDTDYRTLTKVYGLRFVVSITGKGGQFDIVNLVVAIGSGIGFLALASVMCDLILLYIHRSREHYRQGKFSVCETYDDPLKLSILTSA
jgi:hypothetical protein